MATYPGPTVGGPWGVMTQTVCYTGKTASSMRLALITLATIVGLCGGLALGIVARYILKLRLPTDMALSALQLAMPPLIGALIGAVIGFAVALAAVRGGACVCPAPAEGFCITYYYTGLGPSLRIPLPLITSNPAACATVVPAGCP
jgi:hypothetical protein